MVDESTLDLFGLAPRVVNPMSRKAVAIHCGEWLNVLCVCEPVRSTGVNKAI